MKSCMISLVFMSICCAQGQSSIAVTWAVGGAGGLGSQSQSGYEHYQRSQGSGVVSAHAISGDPHFSSSSNAVTSSSGYNENGTRYNRYTVENIIGNTLYHYERLHWPSLNFVNEFRFKLDLSDPRAIPVWDFTPASTDNRVFQSVNTGTNQRKNTGTNQWEYTGTNRQENTGTNQWEHTGTNQRQYTGTGQREYTGTNQPGSTGAPRQEYAGGKDTRWSAAGRPNSV